MSQKFGKIQGDIIRMDNERIVIRTKRGPIHVMIGDDIPTADRENIMADVGKPRSVWAKKAADGRLFMVPLAARQPTVPGYGLKSGYC